MAGELAVDLKGPPIRRLPLLERLVQFTALARRGAQVRAVAEGFDAHLIVGEEAETVTAAPVAKNVEPTAKNVESVVLGETYTATAYSLRGRTASGKLEMK